MKFFPAETRRRNLEPAAEPLAAVLICGESNFHSQQKTSSERRGFCESNCEGWHLYPAKILPWEDFRKHIDRSPHCIFFQMFYRQLFGLCMSSLVSP